MIGDAFTRRRVLLGVCSAALLARASLPRAQEDSDAFYTQLLEQLGDPQAVSKIFTDVYFVHWWRSEIAPRGYEAENDWLGKAQNFQSQVFRKIAEKPPFMVQEMKTQIVEFDAAAQGAYKKNIEAFQKFLDDIGIRPDGKVALRLTSSLRLYLGLVVAANGSDASAATESSYFWPWC